MNILPLLLCLFLFSFSFAHNENEALPGEDPQNYATVTSPFFEIGSTPSLRIGVLYRPDECEHKTKKGDRIAIRYIGRLTDGTKVS